jgi:RecA/RadA recombinase
MFCLFYFSLERIQYNIIKNNVKLIIIDSIASVVKRGFSENNRETMLKRANFLTSISATLKEIAYYFNISVIYFHLFRLKLKT